jgi:hypothetical protein
VSLIFLPSPLHHQHIYHQALATLSQYHQVRATLGQYLQAQATLNQYPQDQSTLSLPLSPYHPVHSIRFLPQRHQLAIHNLSHPTLLSRQFLSQKQSIIPHCQPCSPLGRCHTQYPQQPNNRDLYQKLGAISRL